MAALRGLGVEARAGFADENRSVLTHLRDDGDLTHLYAYHFLYETGEPTTVTLRLPGLGVVHRIDPWSGAIRSHASRGYGDHTLVTVTLAAGEVALFTLDRSDAPTDVPGKRTEVMADLEAWSITIESWDAGDDVTLTEDRGLGYETREVLPTTAVTRIVVGPSPPLPWWDIDEVGPEVSGIGEYTTTLSLDHAPRPEERLTSAPLRAGWER